MYTTIKPRTAVAIWCVVFHVSGLGLVLAYTITHTVQWQ